MDLCATGNSVPDFAAGLGESMAPCFSRLGEAATGQGKAHGTWPYQVARHELTFLDLKVLFVFGFGFLFLSAKCR